MLHPYESDSKILHRTPSESHDEWISRITAHPLEEYERETAELLSDTQVKEIVDEVQNIFSQETNEKKDDLGTDSETAKINDQERRSIKLTKILPILAQLWWLNPERLDITTELLANGSRETIWRIPLGDSGVLEFFLQIFSRHELRSSLKIHVLRLIGNSCADTDENRSRIAASSDYFLAITKQLKFPSMLPYALPVLYNICVDYVPNQELASKSFLTRELGILIKNPTFDKSLPTFEYVCRIMTLLMSQPSEVNFAPDYTVSILFRTLADNKSPVDIDNFITLTKIAICYLQHEKFQKAFICADGSLDDIITVLVDSYTRYDIQPDTAENDDFKALTNLRTSLNQALSDISALPEFTQACPISSHFSKTLQQWLVAPCPKLQLQLCSCFMLGNLARCDETCIEFVQTLQLHKPLITIASKETSSQILHATLCFLKNLAIPLKNKNSIGEERFFHMLCRILTLDNIPQVQFSAASLARQLTIGTYENVYRLLHEKSTGSTATTFSLLCNLFITANDEPIKMEIARLTTSICRVLHSHTGASQNLIESTRAQFFQMYSDTSSHLKYVVSQSKWPVVRSEGWFVLALISRFAEGAKFVNQILQDPEFSELLTQLLVGDIIVSTSSNSTASLSTLLSEESAVSDTLDVRPEPVKPHFKADEMARIDKENALVLVSEILKNVSKDIPVPQCMKLKELLNCGGKYLMDKSKKTKSYNIL
ncbi:putative gtp binding protein [Erysiphe necator]|uniref:Putative gtp binding protein n=1 Tax=Uncinula necator TaxID=52586 RepID=A0A0B1P940_UNCNE|nr:putative gtp binding protein [Erysiphe necator]